MSEHVRGAKLVNQLKKKKINSRRTSLSRTVNLAITIIDCSLLHYSYVAMAVPHIKSTEKTKYSSCP